MEKLVPVSSCIVFQYLVVLVDLDGRAREKYTETPDLGQETEVKVVWPHLNFLA